jgi:hypothetical protein
MLELRDDLACSILPHNCSQDNPASSPHEYEAGGGVTWVDSNAMSNRLLPMLAHSFRRDRNAH